MNNRVSGKSPKWIGYHKQKRKEKMRERNQDLRDDHDDAGDMEIGGARFIQSVSGKLERRMVKSLIHTLKD